MQTVALCMALICQNGVSALDQVNAERAKFGRTYLNGSSELNEMAHYYLQNKFSRKKANEFGFTGEINDVIVVVDGSVPVGLLPSEKHPGLVNRHEELISGYWTHFGYNYANGKNCTIYGRK